MCFGHFTQTCNIYKENLANFCFSKRIDRAVSDAAHGIDAESSVLNKYTTISSHLNTGKCVLSCVLLVVALDCLDLPSLTLYDPVLLCNYVS